MGKLRISARPDGRGWVDYKHKGKIIGSSKPHYRNPLTELTMTTNLRDFVRKHNL